jgi:hypothetical protein
VTRRRALALAVTALFAAACRHTITPPENLVEGLSGAGKIYTLTDLHPGAKGDLSSANFQGPGLIPICSEVTLVKAYDLYLVFHVAGSPVEYWFASHEAGGEPFSKTLARYFGRACPQADLDALTPQERAAVGRGVAEPGMRKQAVILAMGYPPARDTRTLELPTWRYYNSSLKSFLVVFGDDGKVEAVRR